MVLQYPGKLYSFLFSIDILRIDNGGLAMISLRFTFLLIASWLFGPS